MRGSTGLKVLAAKPANQSLTPATHKAEGENWPLCASSAKLVFKMAKPLCSFHRQHQTS